VLRACAVYIVAAWVAVQVAGMLFPAIGVPEEALLYVWLIGASLLPLVVVFSWYFDISADGIARTPPAVPGEDFDPSLRRADIGLLVALGVVSLALLLEFGTRIEPGAVRLDETISPFSIAVLPFDDLSGDPDEQYFVSGMQSSLIDGLSRVRNLRVTSKVSTLPYRQTGGSLLDIAMQLGVARIVEGTVLRDKAKVSIALRMHDAGEDEQVWSARFEDDLENILLLQARAAQEIANQVRVQLGPEEREQFAAARPINPEAYNAVLKGTFHVERFNPEDMRIAATHFQRAVEIDPDYALGHWGLGKLCIFQAQVGILTPEEAREQCLPPIVRALELDPFLPEAHLGLASISTWQLFDWEAARPHWERALELNPSFADAHIFYSHYLGIIGELDKSSEHGKRAVELDPLNPFTIGLYSIQLVMRNENRQAIEVAEQAFSMAPGYAFGYMTLWMAHDALGEEEGVIRAFANMMRIYFNKVEEADFLEAAYERDGFAVANLQLADRLAGTEDSGGVPPLTIAALYELGGDYETAIDWLEIGVERSDPDAPYIGVNIKRREIRDHPRFRALLERMGLDYWAAQL
jgi:TolB-like protein/Tfp pilus assembly protein PilF